MTIEKGLKWRRHPEDFQPDQLRILLALSNKKWLWRTMDSLQRSAGLSREVVTSNLKPLMADGIVRGSIIRERSEPIFGLVERVGLGKSRGKT